MIHSYVAQGWQLSVHTQGDRTIHMVLDIIEALVDDGQLKQDHRFRLEHCALMRQDQLERAQALGVICSFFISHIRYWGAAVEDFLFGPQRAAHYMPAGTAVAAGMTISLHADTPMTDASALALMQTAITRQTLEGRVIGAGEALTVEQALRAVTIDAAYQLFMEDRIGSISAGKYADFVILDANPLKTAPDAIDQINIDETWIAGRRVYRAC
ncbi:MAG: putative amidohydrolase YtcJ [Planctomycetota bacterium]|jgi:predicted amidohydrolase YtcJ